MSAKTQNITSSLTGNLPKAILFVRDPSKAGFVHKAIKNEDGDVKETPVWRGQSRDAEGIIKDIDMDAAGKLNEVLTARAQQALNGNVDTFSSLQKNGLMGGLESLGYLALEVQYNPSSIHMSTVAGRQVYYQGGNAGSLSDNQATQVYEPVSTTIGFQLVFDDMNPKDAFMVNSFGLNGSVASSISNLATETYSVKKQIDGLMALLVSDASRQVVFFWSKMSFRGEVTNINSRYTMFNPKGYPIRGVVEMTIRQGSGSDGQGYDYRYEDQYWNKAIDKVFKDQAEAKSTFDQITQNNFLNLNI